jgi:hypothetical protein
MMRSRAEAATAAGAMRDVNNNQPPSPGVFPDYPAPTRLGGKAREAQSFVWHEVTLDRWLTQPSAVVPGASMAFAGIPKTEDRMALISYLEKAAH